MDNNYVIEMRGITKEFPGIIANDDITLQLKKGEIHALLGENGAGKSTLMSVLFGLYSPEKGEILKNGKPVKISNPNDATALGIGMVHQHFKLVDIFTVLENIILGAEETKFGFIKKSEAREKVVELSKKYGLYVNPDDKIEDITVGMQQRVEILKMLFREAEILIFDEPTAVLTPQEIEELMQIMKNLTAEGKSILFITHKLNEIMAAADRCTVLRKGKCIGTVNIKDTTKQELSRMMVGRDVDLIVEKTDAEPKDIVLDVKNISVYSKLKKNYSVKDVSFNVRAGEIVCIAGIDGNGQTELVHAITGLENLAPSGQETLEPLDIIKKSEGLKKQEIVLISIRKWGIRQGQKIINFSNRIGKYFQRLFNLFKYKVLKDKSVDTNTNVMGKITLCGNDITQASVRLRSKTGMSHIPEDRHKHGLILDYTLGQNLILERYYEHEYQKLGFIKNKQVKNYAEKLIKQYDVRSGQGTDTVTRSMSGGNQQKAIVAREIDKDPKLLVAVQPTRGLDVGAIEYIHKQLISKRDGGAGVLLISLELEEVMNVSDRILVIYEGEIVAELNPKEITVEQLGLYMSGAERQTKKEKVAANE